MKRFFPLIIVAMVLFSACRKVNDISTDPSYMLKFSTDTVMFDTVFTTLGSSTHQLKVYNPYQDDLNISEIRLMGGEESRFKLNFDGESGVAFQDVVVPSNDSLYAFLRVTIDPSDVTTPFVVEDSLMFITNGNTQMVKLVAWGQNARYIVADRELSGFPKFKIIADSLETVHWTNELPYVIYGYALINSYGTLHIHEGTRIYVHGGGGIWSWSDGQLIIDGTAENPVTIQGDRLEPFFKDQPGQWDRIWLMDARPGADHLINHAIIRNGFIGIATIVTAYALLLGIMVVGIIAILKPKETARLEQLKSLSTAMLYPAVALLAMGIFIGAVWANVSWGNYWSWDPKEVWALITLLIYAAPLHGKLWKTFDKPLFFHIYSILAFLSVVITYFGVNLILGGVHAYN